MYLFILFAFLLAPQAATQTASDTIHIEGTVVDGNTGKPIAGARIITTPTTALIAPGTGTVSPRGGPVLGSFVSTDADGNFSAEVTPAATRFQITKEGYMPARPEGRTAPGNSGIPLMLATIRSGGNRLAVKMYPAAVISGRVLDHRGMPAANASITPFVYQYSDTGVRMRRDIVLNIRTDDRGEFRAGIDAGDYFLEARPASAGIGDPPGMMLRPVFFPGVLDPLKAEFIHVKSGAETAVPVLHFVSAPATSLRVRISNPTGQTLVRAMVEVYLKEEGTRRSASATAPLEGGDVEIPNLVPGLYRVAIECQTSSRGRAFGVADVQVLDGAVTVNVTLQNILNETISGRAITIAPTAAESLPIAGVRFGIYDRIDANFRGTPTHEFTSGADGAIRTTQHSPNPPSLGKYYVRVMETPPGTAVTAILEGTRNILREGYEFQSGKQASLIAMVDTNPGIVQGSVVDSQGKKIDGASIVLIPDASAGPLLSAFSDDSGLFSLNATAGTYHLFAWRETSGAPWLDPVFLKNYESHGVAVEIAPGARKTLELKIADVPM